MIKKYRYADNINITKDWIVFLSTNSDNDTIMKMVRIDGEKEKEL